MAALFTPRFAHPYWPAWVFLFLQPIPILGVGVFAYAKAPGHPTARRLLLAGSFYGLSVGLESVLGAGVESRGVFAGFWIWNLIDTTLDVVAILFAVRFFALFPDGRIERRHERIVLGSLWLVALVPLAIVLAGPTLAFPKNVFLSPPRVVTPFTVAWVSPIGAFARGMYQARIQLLFVGLMLLLIKFRRSSIEQRQQIKWVLYSIALMGVAQAVPQALGVAGALPHSAIEAASPYLQTPILTVTLIASVVAMFRYRALDIDLVIRRSLVYGGLWLGIGAAYVGVASALGIAASRRLPVGAAIVVTVAATLAFGPVHRRLERLAVLLREVGDTGTELT